MDDTAASRVCRKCSSKGGESSRGVVISVIGAPESSQPRRVRGTPIMACGASSAGAFPEYSRDERRREAGGLWCWWRGRGYARIDADILVRSVIAKTRLLYGGLRICFLISGYTQE